MFRTFPYNLAKVIRVVKRVHISGRWPTSHQYRFGRYVLGTMLKVVGSPFHAVGLPPVGSYGAEGFVSLLVFCPLILCFPAPVYGFLGVFV